MTASRRRRLIARLLEELAECFYCGRGLNQNRASLDHVVPRSRGGSNCDGNFVLACRRCNGAKADAMPSRLVFPEARGGRLRIKRRSIAGANHGRACFDVSPQGPRAKLTER